MSAIFGVLQLDGSPIDIEPFYQMMDKAVGYGQDRKSHWNNNTIALGYCGTCITEESYHEQQPCWNETATQVIIGDGRLDNRDELLGRLGLCGPDLVDLSDFEIILRIYEQLGSDCFRLLAGDYAFAIWDSGQQNLRCIRDIAGQRTFYYHRNARSLVFSSKLDVLTIHPDVGRDIDEGYILDYLSRHPFLNQETTIYRDIRSLKPGHYLIAGKEGITETQYWSVEDIREIRYRNEDDYFEHFRDLFFRVVKAHLRSRGVVAATLSGGLDSSSIVSAAAEICQREPGKLETFSWVYRGLPDCDESQ